jgi:hypothetical protein
MERIDVGSLCVALIGYGEVGAILGRALVERGVARVAAYDIVIDDPLGGHAMRAAAERDGVTLATTNAEAIGGASLILCAVTASSALDAARESARALAPQALFVDLNSASPRTKRECAGAIDTGGGLYVEAAVMTSVSPYGIRVPMLLGGPHAAQAQPLLATLGFCADVASSETGVASAIKMCRSVVIKGMEALARRRARRARFARRDVSRHRLGQAGVLLLEPRREARPASRRGNARVRFDGRRRRVRAVDGRAQRGLAGVRRRSRGTRRVRRRGSECGLASAGRSRAGAA